MASLPPELLLVVFQCARYDAYTRTLQQAAAHELAVDSEYHIPVSALYFHALRGQRTLAAAARVARAWHTPATAVLYAAPLVVYNQSPVFFASALGRLSAVVCARAELAAQVRVLTLLDPPTGEFGCAPDAVALDMKRLWKLVAACVNLRALHAHMRVVPHVTGGPRSTWLHSLRAPLTHLLDSLFDTPPERCTLSFPSVDCLFAASPGRRAFSFPASTDTLVLTATVDGGWASPSFDARWLRAPFTPDALRTLPVRLPHLRVLELRELRYCALGALEFPALESLTITRCTHAPTVTPLQQMLGTADASLLPRAAPHLRVLVLVRNSFFSWFNTGSIMRFVDTLERLVLAGEEEVSLLADAEWLTDAPALRELTLGIGVRSAAGSVYGLPRLPKALRTLTIVRSADKTVRCVDLSAEALGVLVAHEQSYWSDLRLLTSDHALNEAAAIALRTAGEARPELAFSTTHGKASLGEPVDALLSVPASCVLIWKYPLAPDLTE